MDPQQSNGDRYRKLFRHVVRPAEAEEYAALEDRELVARYLGQRDQGAFRQLVRRHGPPVERVCTQVLGRSPDAEDASQAAFLVLSRRLDRFDGRRSLANWLYGIAVRCARKVRSRLARKQRLVRPAGGRLPEPAYDPGESQADLFTILHEEVNRLPKSFRDTLVCLEFRGLSYDEAARELGCSKVLLRQWRVRARDRLRVRLAKRKVELSAALLMASMAGPGAAGLSVARVEGIVGRVGEYAAGTGSAAARVADAVLREQLHLRLARLALAGALAAVLVASAALALPRDKPDPPPTPAAPLPEPAPPPRFEQLGVLAEGLNAFCLAVSPDGSRLAVAKNKGVPFSWVEVWDVSGSAPKIIRRLDVPFLGITRQTGFRTLAFHGPDLLAAGTRDGRVIVWDLRNLAAPTKVEWPAHAGTVSDLAFAARGTLVVTVSEDKTLKRWRREPDGWSLVSAEPVPFPASVVRLSPDGARLAVGSREWVRVYDAGPLATAGPLPLVTDFVGHDSRALAFHPTDSTLLAATRGHDLVLLRVTARPMPVVRTFAEPGLGMAHRDDIECLAYSPDGRFLVSASADKSVKLWAADTGERLDTRHLGGTGNISAAFAPDGRVFVTGDNQTILFRAIR